MSTFALPETMRLNSLAELKEQLTPLVQADEDLELDGSGVASLDTAGFQLIIAAKLELNKRDKKMTLKDPSEAIQKAITICGAESLFEAA